MEQLTQLIGLISAALTTLAFLPQVIKTWKTRSTSDLSPLMFTLFFIGIAGWLTYGLLIHDLPIILANLVTICLAGIILFYIIRGDKSVKISHIGIFVSDLEMMKEFYCTHFQGKPGPLYRNEKNKFSSYFIIFSGKTSLEIMHKEDLDFQPSTQQHLAFSLGSRKRVDDLTLNLSEQGYTVLQDPRLTGDGYYESKIEDPEGNHIEITT
ncbi:MAG: SemiSWEET transporter [Bacteroidales bacterium]|nr:SemiSWEET transporter [Bacteroidales bacterium]